MIRHKITIKYRDDTTLEYDCYDGPYIGASYLTLYLSPRLRKNIPLEAIGEFTTEDYWLKDKK